MERWRHVDDGQPNDGSKLHCATKRLWAISTSGAIVGRMLNLSAVITATAFDWIPLVRATVTNSEQTASNGYE